MSTPTLVACFAHPDDEAFSCAGTLAAAAEAGIETRVVCATRGEAGRARDGLPGELAARRTQELIASCQALGTATPQFLDLPDGALEAHRDALQERIADAVTGASAVITFGPDGVYGHRDHIACTRALAAVEATLLHTVFPPGLFDELRRRLRRSPVPVATGDSQEQPTDYVVDIRPYRGRKLASIAAHRSQLDGGDPQSFLIPGLVEPLLTEERYHHASGPPLEGALAALLDKR